MKETVIQTIGGPVTVKKDFYMGGWRIWSSPFQRFTDERFSTKKDALAYLERYLPE